MTLLLVFPPFTDASQPNAAIPSLVAAVRNEAVPIEVCDANLEAWEYLLAPERQARWLQQANHRLGELDRRQELDDTQRAEYLAVLDGCLRGEAALPHLQSALDVLRSARFYSPRAYSLAQQAIRGGLALVSAVHHPARLEWGRFWPACRIASSQQIVRSATAIRTNPFVRYAREHFVPKIRTIRPKLIGFSVTYLDQVVPAITLARACRRELPEARIVFGGQIVSLWADDLLRAKALWPWADFFVCGEGETALRCLVKWVRGQGRLEDVPNLIRPAGGAPPIKVQRETLATLPCPDYSCVPLRRYLSPEPVLLLSASRGCYWGRCSFCSVSPGFRPGYRARPSATVLEDLQRLQSLYGARHIMFGDDALPPGLVRALAAQDNKNLAPVYWQAEVRWDALAPAIIEPLARAGARNFVIGLESGNENVLKQMNKGASLAHARRLMKACQRAGIGVNLQCFLGFPTETQAQALDTLRFIREFIGGGVTVSCGKFVVVKGSAVWRDPTRFGACLPQPTPGDDLSVQSEWRPRYGPKRQQRLIQRVDRMAQGSAPQLSCGINAHALLFLASEKRATEEPVSLFDPHGPLRVAVRASWRLLAWDPESLHSLRPPTRQATTVAFSLANPAWQVLGPLSGTLLRACSRPGRGADLLAGLDPAERKLVQRRLRVLARKGLIENASA